MRIAQILVAVGALMLAIATPIFAESQGKLPKARIPSSENVLPKVQPCRAPCEWAFNKCMKKVNDTFNRQEDVGYSDKQKQEIIKCSSAKYTCLKKRKCPAGDVDCTKTKTC